MMRGHDDCYILTGSKKPVEPKIMESWFKKVIVECGIKDATFHSTRHTFATRCVEAGMNIKALSEILGHADVSITLNRYVHPSMEQKKKEMGLLTFLC